MAGLENMDPLVVFWVFLIGTIAGLLIGITLVYRSAVSPLRKKIEELSSQKQSLSTTYGKISEQFAPFMEKYPYSHENFRFIGNPVDGIQFEKDCIYFVEFKTNKSKLSSMQQHIKKLVENGRIKWFEFRMK